MPFRSKKEAREYMRKYRARRKRERQLTLNHLVDLERRLKTLENAIWGKKPKRRK